MNPSSWILILTTLIWEPEARLQKLSVFSENCCKGRGEPYENSVRNLEEVSMTVSRGHMKSFSIHHGLWSLSLGVNYTKDGIYYEGNNDDLHGNCGSSAQAGGGEFIQYKSIRLVGNVHLDLPGLSLFTAESFQGPELYFDGTNLRLPSPYVFKSYGFTGRDNWTVFPLTNFSGGSSCLIAQNKLVSFIQKGTTITLGSLQRGCVLKQDGKKPPARSKTLHSHQALILYSEINQNGERIYTDALELRLPLSLTFKSHSFVGSKNWTVFGGIDLSGPSVCLFNPKSSVHDRSKTTPVILQPISVGSIRRGCDTDPVALLPEKSDHQMDMTGGTAYLSSRPLALAILAFLLLIVT